MLKKGLLNTIIIILMLLKPDGYAQVSMSDSIIASLSSSPDSIALTRLKEHALNELNRSLKTGLAYADERMKIARKNGNNNAIAETWHIYGNLYGSSGLSKDAEKAYIKALAIYDSLNMIDGKASILHNLGLVYFNKQDTLKSIEYYKKSIELRKNYLNERRVGDELTTLGETYLAYKQYENSRKCLLKAMDYFNDIRGYHRKLENYAYLFDNNLATGKGDPQRWIDSMIIENKIIRDTIYNSMINIRIAKLYLNNNKPEKAQQYIKKTDLSILHKKEVVDYNSIHSKLSDLFLKKGNEKKAIQYRLAHYQHISDMADLEIRELSSNYNIRLSIRSSEEEIEWSQEQNRLILQRIKIEKTISLIIYLALSITLVILLFLIYNLRLIRKTNKKLETRRTRLHDAYLRSTRYKENILATRKNKSIFFSIISINLSKPFDDIANKLTDINHYLNNCNNKDLKLKKKLENLYHKASEIEKRLERILLWSKLQRNKYQINPVSLNLNEFMHKLLPSLLSSSLKKDIKIRFDIDPELTVYYDRYSLKTIIEIFAENSIEHSAPGTDIVFRAVRAESGCLLSLTDFGSGIAGDLQNEIFDINKVSNNKEKTDNHKTGLGLLIAALLAEKNNSIISLESKENSGTTLFIHIKDND